MSRKQTVTTLYNRYLSEESEINARVSELDEELSSLRTRLDEVRVIRHALAAQTSEIEAAKPAKPAKPAAKKSAPKKAGSKKSASKKSASKKVAPKKAAPAPKAPAPKATAPKATAPKAPAVKGRRKAGGRSSIHRLGIVDAAIELARKNGSEIVDAGQILDWFEAIGYKSRTGTPTRNSIYVSLNREVTEGQKKGAIRVERPSRGKFRIIGVTPVADVPPPAA